MENLKDETAEARTESAPAIKPRRTAGANTQISAKRQLEALPTRIFAQLGVLALAVGLGAYLWQHIFVLAYLLVAYAYIVADILIRPPYDPAANRDTFQMERPMLVQMLTLAVFAAAPFERSYFHAIDAPTWLSASGLVLELLGVTVALLARIQLGSFGTPHLTVQDKQHVVRSGLYNQIRHPLYAGSLLSGLAWPIVYGAPITLVLTTIYRMLMFRRRIKIEEALMLEKFGTEYELYAQATSRLIPGIY